MGVETWDALRSRRNVREFSSAPVSEEDLADVPAATEKAIIALQAEELLSQAEVEG